jgi:hypothetical protein
MFRAGFFSQLKSGLTSAPLLLVQGVSDMALLQPLLPIERPRCPRCRDMSAPCPVIGHRESVASAPRDAAFHPALPHCEKKPSGRDAERLFHATAGPALLRFRRIYRQD